MTNRTTAQTNMIISARILTLIADGATVAQAMDAVLGAGTHARLVSDLYDALRTKAVRQ